MEGMGFNSLTFPSQLWTGAVGIHWKAVEMREPSPPPIQMPEHLCTAFPVNSTLPYWKDPPLFLYSLLQEKAGSQERSVGCWEHRVWINKAETLRAVNFSHRVTECTTLCERWHSYLGLKCQHWFQWGWHSARNRTRRLPPRSPTIPHTRKGHVSWHLIQRMCMERKGSGFCIREVPARPLLTPKS